MLTPPRVDRYARICVRQCHYPVPARPIGRRVRVVLRASQLLVFDGRTQVACHERAVVRGSEQLQLDHYLEVLTRKPGALPGATALAQARKAKAFTATHEAFRAAARKALGDSGGTRALVEVLLHRHHRPRTRRRRYHRCTGRRRGQSRRCRRRNPQMRPAHRNPAAAADPVVVSLTGRRPAEPAEHLPPDLRPLPSVEHYDSLLTGTSNP